MSRNEEIERAAKALVESMDLAGHCPDCGKPSWGDEIPRPHHEGCKVAALRLALSRSSRPAESGEAVAWAVMGNGRIVGDDDVWTSRDEADEYCAAYRAAAPSFTEDYRVVPLYAHPPVAPATEAKCGSEGASEEEGVGSPAHVALWDAINSYAVACGGRTNAPGNGPRMSAVARIEAAIRALRPAAGGGE